MRCRLYLVSPPEAAASPRAAADFARDVGKAVDAGDVAALLLKVGEAEEASVAALVAAVKPAANRRGVALLLEGRADLAMALGCDGVQLPANPTSLRAVRKAIGQDMILGVDCGGSRHLAMLAGEIGCDYVTFSASAPEAIAWWAELMEVPCVAAGGITLESAPELIEAGADFLAVGRAVFANSRGPATAVKAFNRLMAEAAR